MIKNLTPSEVDELLKSDKNILLIDVREPWEYETAKIENSQLMPLSKFAEESMNLNPDDNIIIYCHHGVRSLRACSFLVNNGYKNVINLDGGINAWSREVDPSVPRY